MYEFFLIKHVRKSYMFYKILQNMYEFFKETKLEEIMVIIS